MTKNTFECLKFILNSSSQHRVHSPFVYDFVTKCIYKKTPKTAWKFFLEKVKFANLLANKKSKLLFRIAEYFNVKNVLNFDNNSKRTTDFLMFKEDKSAINYNLIHTDINLMETDSLKIIDSNLSKKTTENILILDNIYVLKR